MLPINKKAVVNLLPTWYTKNPAIVHKGFLVDMFAAFLYNLAVFIPVISVIVFVHEFGHYYVAKRCGVKVVAFSIGFGKEIFGWNDTSGTRWKICWLPFGGYVKMFGDINPASAPDPNMQNLSDEDKKNTFHFKPLPKKAAIVAAGPFANFLFTVIVLTFFFSHYGKVDTPTKVGEILEGSAAQQAGLLPGDVILSVDGEKMQNFSDIARVISLNQGTAVEVVFLRKNAEQTVQVTPQLEKVTDALGNEIKIGRIGVKATEGNYQKLNILQAIPEAVKETYYICTGTLKALGQMVVGQRGLEDLGGPIRIAKYSGQASKKGFSTVLWLMALISANLGLINLFPIPALDGGHLLYYIIEAVQGRPLAEKFQEYGLRFGIAVIIALALFATFNDIRLLL